jgi:hypothetical protein
MRRMPDHRRRPISLSDRPVRVAGFILFLIGTAPAGAADGLGFSIGAEYTRGDYGTSTTTDIGYFPLVVSYAGNAASISLTVPYLVVRGTGDVVVVGGQGMKGRTRTTTTRTVESGIGDVIAAATVGVLGGDSDKAGLDVTAKVKFGTADAERGLGTGENDYSIQLNVFETGDTVTLFGSLGYKALGDTPTVEFDNVLFGTLGGEARFDAKTFALAVDAQQSGTEDAEGRRELTATYTHALGGGRSLAVYAIKGFSDGSPDWGAGIKLAFGNR